MKRKAAMTVDLEYLRTAAGEIDADELRMILAYIETRSFSDAGRVTGHHRNTVSATVWRLLIRMKTPLESILPTPETAGERR